MNRTIGVWLGSDVKHDESDFGNMMNSSSDSQIRQDRNDIVPIERSCSEYEFIADLHLEYSPDDLRNYISSRYGNLISERKKKNPSARNGLDSNAIYTPTMNTPSPIERIPDEIIQEISTWASSPFKISQLSRRLRRIAFDTPTLWQVFYTTCRVYRTDAHICCVMLLAHDRFSEIRPVRWQVSSHTGDGIGDNSVIALQSTREEFCMKNSGSPSVRKLPVNSDVSAINKGNPLSKNEAVDESYNYTAFRCLHQWPHPSRSRACRLNSSATSSY
jgi:hypothetical protein